VARPPTTPAVRRRGFFYRGLWLILAALVGVPTVAWSVWPDMPWSEEEGGPLMHAVQRGDFLHEIIDRGNVESANNTEVRCEVKSKNLSGTTILEIVPEGTMVKKGDVLAKLDSSALENERLAQQIVCSNSEANVIQAKNVYDTAVIAEVEYLEGTYKKEKQLIESEIFVAEENKSRAEEYLRYSERLAAKGYVTPAQLKADRFALKKAETDLDTAQTKLDVLRKFTREKMAKSLEADKNTAKAKLKSVETSHRLDLEQLELIETQIKRCVITAPEEGQVVYANVSGYRGTKEVLIAAGELVRERQAIIRLPDPKRMQVIAKINEAKIALVAAGMPATIGLDAFPDMQLTGTVEKVNEFPVPTGFFGSSVKEYETTVRIHDPPPGLRPGLTAEVRIQVERLSNVLQVPVQSLFEHGGKYYCVVRESGTLRAREVSIGSTNDKSVVIRQGLDEGQQIVLNAAAFRGKVDLPELTAEKGSDRRNGLNRRAAGNGPPPSGPTGGKPAEARPAAAGEKKVDPAAAAAKMFAQFDRNGDGRLDKDEIPQAMQSQLMAADANGDEAVDQSEFRAAASRFLQPGGQKGRRGNAP